MSIDEGGGLILAVGDFKCPKCGAQMEEGHMRIDAGRGFSIWFKPECLPWKVPLEEVEEGKKKKQSEYEPILEGLFNYDSDVHRCPKCRLVLLGY